MLRHSFRFSILPSFVALLALLSGSCDGGLDDADGGAATMDATASWSPRVRVITYPHQPMVVELAFEGPGLSVELNHADDPGVRSALRSAPEQPDETHLRVRGLRPATEHQLAWMATDADGRVASGIVIFRAEDALAGFRPSFPIEGAGAGPDGYLLFDLLEQGAEGASSLFVVDGDGITRWHISRADGLAGPTSVFAGASLDAHGAVLFLRDHALESVDELGQRVTRFTASELGVSGLHHDVVRLSNGNLLALSYVFQEIDYVDLGQTLVAGDRIIEVDPEGAVVWSWDSFDHLDPQRRREGFDQLVFDPVRLELGRDWSHGNGLVHDPASDTILLSLRHQDWIVQVDHTTGDVIWRFGAEGDFTLESGSWPYHQHSPQWQSDGSLLLYDNGVGNPELDDSLERSRAVRFTLDDVMMRATEAWQDDAMAFVSPIAGDADRLADGTLLVTDSSLDMAIGRIHARVRQTDEDPMTQADWSFTTEPGTFIYRCVSIPRLPGEVQ